jgi:hypothetical protein
MKIISKTKTAKTFSRIAVLRSKQQKHYQEMQF